MAAIAARNWESNACRAPKGSSKVRVAASWIHDVLNDCCQWETKTFFVREPTDSAAQKSSGVTSGSSGGNRASSVSGGIGIVSVDKMDV